MIKWNRSKKQNAFGGQLQKLQSKIPFFTEECLNFCRDIGLEADVLKADVDAIKNCIVSLEERVCDIIPEYVLDGGCARLVEMVSLLDDFLHRKIVYDKSKDKDGGKKRLAEVMSSIHISTRKLDFLRREVEKGVGTDYKKTNWCRIVGCLLVVLGLFAEFVAWLVYYDGCIFVEYYWKLGLALLVLITGLVLLWKSKRRYDLYAATIDCPYEPKSVEQNNIVRALKLYCLSSDIDYANMINGPWGAGKTYFINTVMRPALHECGKELFYVSLNGVNSFDDVVKQIVFGQRGTAIDEIKQSCVIPLCEKYIPKETAKYVLTNWRDWLGIGRNDAGYIRSRLGDFLPDRSVIFVDDVERVEQVDVLKRLMGKMHEEFVCKGYHVVYSGDESVIKSLPEFNKVKEKYIRHTYPFPLDVSAIVDTFIAGYPSGGANHRHAMRCGKLLKEFAIQFRVQNARTVKRILDDFLFVANQVGDEELLSKISQTLFGRIAPIATELATGRLNVFDADVVASLKNIEGELAAMQAEHLFKNSGSLSGTNVAQKEKPISYVREFISRYGIDMSFGWKLEAPIANYELFGLCDGEKIREVVEGWRPFAADKYLVALHTIWGWYSIEDGELVENWPIVEEGLKTGRYNAENAKLACELLYRFNKDGWISVDIERTIKLAAQALQSRWAKLPNDEINPMILHNPQEDFLKPITDVIREEQSRRNTKSIEDEVTAFLTALERKDKETAWSFLPQGSAWPILDKIVEAGKCDAFCSLSNWALTLILTNLKDGALFARPSSRSTFERIVNELDMAIASCDKKKPMRRAVLNEVRERFLDILKKPEFQRS